MNEAVQIRIAEGPLETPQSRPPSGVGAWVVFDGIVRLLEEGRELAALDYEAYEPMTTREMGRLAADIVKRHGLLAIAVEHSVGRVAVGETSFRLSVGAKHRAEALAAADEFILRMKRDVPLWKSPCYA